MQLSKFYQAFMLPFSDNPLLCISNGTLALNEVATETKNALLKGIFWKMLLLKVVSYCIHLSTGSLLV